jgi:hypothetical protein
MGFNMRSTVATPTLTLPLWWEGTNVKDVTHDAAHTLSSILSRFAGEEAIAKGINP